MTNVSAVEKMAELMQQMEENSPRVATLQYCLTQVAEKVGEAEKRNAELEARCAALAAENAGLKSAIKEIIDSAEEAEYDGYFSFVVNPDAIHAGADLIESETPSTDAYVSERGE